MVVARRLTREDWIAVARKVLVKSGIDDVKVDRLAKRMKVTRGSFYWHFEDRQALLDALLEDWRGRNVREIEQIAARWATTPLDFVEVVRIWLGEDPIVPQFDTAIRAWARKSPAVARLVHETDKAWVTLLQSHFTRMGLGPDESLVRARVVYFHQIGYYALAIDESIEERVRLAPFYNEVLTGQRPTPELEAMLRSLIERTEPRKRARSKAV
ncbi:TetR/AcrR family transcriptional regulator [Sphingomonas populi]|uniref:TetR/AcrR family transcriptional regulator n=1 Tax=Sphingomonas populi TaxID=2484750 RepID=A0A4Q6Y129_9SPHN|nr:TetR/AcrR family transcriptional regulator [Sphingomonas populi]RZF63882.1 TetR/AcrR family transcriptional regulator [Sphingomonas populi]